MRYRYLGLLWLILPLTACRQSAVPPTIVIAEKEVITPPVIAKTATEQRLDSLHLVEIRALDSMILVELKYASADNFTGKILYEDLTRAYLQPEAAQMLLTAQRYLKEACPALTLLVYDAARPMYVQCAMYEMVRNTPKRNYVANPDRTGLHNYGAAVDITLADSTGQPLDMGTPFDFFGIKASIHKEDSLLRAGLLTQKQIDNRRLLRQAMTRAGFRTVRGEWWHFNACSLSEAKMRYQLIE